MTDAPRVVALTEVTHPEFRLANFERLAAEAPSGSVLFILRERELPVREQLFWGRALSELATRFAQSFGVAGRLDVALGLGARAMHLGHRDVDVARVRRAFPDAWLSGAWHRGEPVPAGFDALFVSPVFSERKGRAALGPGGLAEAARSLRDGGFAGRLYALGGVSGEHVSEALESGADGVAVLGLLRDAEAVRALALAVTSTLPVRTPGSPE